MIIDPTPLYRLRDGSYAPDLLVAAIAELDLFSRLADKAASIPELCTDLALATRPADVMITYLVALGLLERHPGDRVALTELARTHLVKGSRYDLRPYFASLCERPAVDELTKVLRTDEPAAWSSAAADADWESRLADPEFAGRFTAAMDARSAFLGPALAEALADLPFQAALDIAGGSGGYACALVDRRPDVQASVLERHPVDGVARTLLADRGYADRVAVVCADMFSDPMPAGYDLHLYSHVLHDWGEDQVRALFAASFAALSPGGRLVDHDVHINQDKTGPLPAAEYSIFLMHSTSGKCWSTGELREMLHDTGFRFEDVRPAAGDRSVVVARKP